jgi:MATE family, multidrug efflux pump
MNQIDQQNDSIVVPGTRAGSMSEVWKLAYPTIVAMLSTTLMWTIDTIFLGRVGKVELAAAGFGGVFLWTLYTFFVGTVTAVSTFVSQAKGSGDCKECAIFTWQGIYVALGATAILALFWWQMEWLLSVVGHDADVAAECLRYTRGRMLGAFFVLGMFSLASFYRGIGDVKTPMVIAIIANLINAGLDACLIFGLGPFPRLTTLGAGLATAIANGVNFLLLLILFLMPKINRRYQSLKSFRFRTDYTRRLLKVGTPLGIQFFLDMGSFTVFMAIMGRLGTNQLAASQIGVQLLSFSFMPANGIAKAATTLVGQYIGAGRHAMAERCGWVTMRLNLIYSIGIAVIFLVAQDKLFSVFNTDPAVVAAGISIIPHLALFQIFDAVQMNYSGCLQGAGDTTFTMIVYALSSWLIFAPLAYILAYHFDMGITGGWTGGLIHFAILNTILTLRFRSGVWKHRKI